MALMYQWKAIFLRLVIGVNPVSDPQVDCNSWPGNSGIKCRFLISLVAEGGNGPGESAPNLRISA